MAECCATCKRWLELVMFDYSHGGCDHHFMGHVCTVLQDEGQIVWMFGNDPETELCECYEPREA